MRKILLIWKLLWKYYVVKLSIVERESIWQPLKIWHLFLVEPGLLLFTSKLYLAFFVPLPFGNIYNKFLYANFSQYSKTVAELKMRFPNLQQNLRNILANEMEKVCREEKFLKDEPDRLEVALRRCKKLTGTLVTLKR